MRQKKLNTPEKRARVGERIKVAATQAGLSLKELAEQAGTSPSLIYQYVRGITSIPPAILERIANVTRVHSDFFDPEKDARAALALPADNQDSEGAPSSGSTYADPGTQARIQAEFRHLHALTEAHDYPRRNRGAYISSLQQMLALSRALENRKQEAWILWQLGRALIAQNQLDDARQKLVAAREIFVAENMEDMQLRAAQDLALVLGAQEAFELASGYLEDVSRGPVADVRWRGLLALGELRYRQHDFEGALRFFLRAAEQVASLEAGLREREAMPQLLRHLALVASATGHYESAARLWRRCLALAATDRAAEPYHEALVELGQCCMALGRFEEARQRLEMAVGLATFAFDEEARLSVAQAILAQALTALGANEEARDSARSAMRQANRAGTAVPAILAALARAETSLAAGQWEDALEYAEEALSDALPTRRTREVSRVRELRARAYLRQREAGLASGDGAQAPEILGRALSEATAALEAANRAGAVYERLAAGLTLTRCYLAQENDEAAEQSVRTAIELIEGGEDSVSELIHRDTENLPALVRSPELDIAGLFSGKKLEVPTLEWQARYLEASLLVKRSESKAAYAALRQAAQALSSILSHLSKIDIAAFAKRHPEIGAVVQDLARLAPNKSAGEEAAALLADVRGARLAVAAGEAK